MFSDEHNLKVFGFLHPCTQIFAPMYSDFCTHTQNFAPMVSDFCTHVLGFLHPCQKQRPSLVLGSTPIFKREVLFLSLSSKSEIIYNSGSAGHQKTPHGNPLKIGGFFKKKMRNP